MVPPRSVAESLVEALERVEVDGKRVLIARAAEARDVLPDALRERGAEVDVLALYDTVAEPLSDAAARRRWRRADYVTFTSSSTVRSSSRRSTEARSRTAARIVSIGPVTSATARERGLEVAVEAEQHDIDGLVAALVEDAAMIVTLLTDYGRDDDFVGVCHGVIRSIAPEAQIIDVTHGIPRYGVRRGAIALRNTLPYIPSGVHVGIVDPQVGTERRAIALRCGDGRVLVGPDNGLLSLAWEVAGGVELAVDMTRSPHRLEPVSATFHGRDVFAPVAGHLAAGAPIEARRGAARARARSSASSCRSRGSPTEPSGAHALTTDRFGNVALNVRHDDLAGTGLTLGSTVEVEAKGERFLASFATTFADVGRGEVIVYEDAYRTLALAINRGDAAATLGVRARRRGRSAAAMIGRPRVHHRLTDSTNERAKELARSGAPHGTTVTADEQTAGRGRQGRAWVAAPGDALLMSVVVRDLERRHALLPLMAALAVCDAAAESAGLDCMIKWPNDVWVDGRKLSGILVEGRPQEGWAVLGIGLNVRTATSSPRSSRSIATSLALEAPNQPAVMVALVLGLAARRHSTAGSAPPRRT